MIALRLRDRCTLSLRSARRSLLILCSSLSLSFHDFVNLVKLPTNQCLLLSPTPTFDLSFPSQCIVVILCFFRSPHQLCGTAGIGIGRRLNTLFVLPETFLDIICTPCVVRAISAFENVNNVWHRITFRPERSERSPSVVEGQVSCPLRLRSTQRGVYACIPDSDSDIVP
jgi:hypothetical protein